MAGRKAAHALDGAENNSFETPVEFPSTLTVTRSPIAVQALSPKVPTPPTTTLASDTLMSGSMSQLTRN